MKIDTYADVPVTSKVIVYGSVVETLSPCEIINGLKDLDAKIKALKEVPGAEGSEYVASQVEKLEKAQKAMLEELDKRKD